MAISVSTLAPAQNAVADVVATDVVSQLSMSYPVELDMCKYRLQGGSGTVKVPELVLRVIQEFHWK